MPRDAEVIVIGGGAIGICTAYHLWKNGVTVAVLEKNEIGSGCSYGNAGLVVPSHIIPLAAPGMIAKGLKWMFNPESPFYLKPRIDLDFFSWLWHFHVSSSPQRCQNSIPILHELLQASAALFEEFAHAQKFEFGYEKRGLLMLYKTQQDLAAERVVAEQARALGLQVSELSPDEILALEPNARTLARGAMYYHGDAHLEPAQFVLGLSHFLSGNGVAIHAHTAVTGLETSGNRVSVVQTSRGAFTAREVVLAGGAWSPQILQALRLKLPLQAGKGYSITLPAPPKPLRIPLILHEARVVITPLQGKLRFAGTMELAGLDPSINQRRVRAILAAVPEYLPDLNPITQIESAEIWSGLRPCTPDGLPYLARFREYPNLIAATGHAMLGLALAPITGKLVADLVCGRRPSVALEALRCERFN